jgi:outer membrane biosynthesis protein TonB
VGLVKLIHGLEISLDQSARETVRNWVFTPATKNGKPVPVWADVFINFVLPDS